MLRPSNAASGFGVRRRLGGGRRRKSVGQDALTQLGQQVLHVGDGDLHLGAALVLRLEMHFELRDLVGETDQLIAALAVRKFRADAVPRVAQSFDKSS